MKKAARKKPSARKTSVKKASKKKRPSPGMKRGLKPFVAKLRSEMRPQVVDAPEGRGRMLLPTPLLLAREIARLGCGELATLRSLRDRMARRHKADLACPLMTGIFFNIVAGAAEEQLAAGQPPLAPYWRVVLEKGQLSPKTPDGPARQAERLREEGHKLTAKRGKLFVVDFVAT